MRTISFCQIALVSSEWNEEKYISSLLSLFISATLKLNLNGFVTIDFKFEKSPFKGLLLRLTSDISLTH